MPMQQYDEAQHEDIVSLRQQISEAMRYNGDTWEDVVGLKITLFPDKTHKCDEHLQKPDDDGFPSAEYADCTICETAYFSHCDWKYATSWEEAQLELDRLFNCGYGTQEGATFKLWTHNNIYSDWEYDGSCGVHVTSIAVDDDALTAPAP